MPFFGSKKDKSKSKSEKPAYPSQAAVYPTQPQGAHPAQFAGVQPPPGAQPPPYTPAGAAAPPTGAPYPYPGQAAYPMQPNYGYAQAGVAPIPQFAPGTHVVGHGTFDAGARFNSGASMNIPPPPPGFAPNAAQIANMHGGTVHMAQGRSGFFSTGSDGGVSTHID